MYVKSSLPDETCLLGTFGLCFRNMREKNYVGLLLCIFGRQQELRSQNEDATRNILYLQLTWISSKSRASPKTEHSAAFIFRLFLFLYINIYRLSQRNISISLYNVWCGDKQKSEMLCGAQYLVGISSGKMQ